MLPFPVGLDNQILAPGTSVEQGGKKRTPLVDAMQTAEVQDITRMQTLRASIDLQHAQIFRELQMSDRHLQQGQPANKKWYIKPGEAMFWINSTSTAVKIHHSWCHWLQTDPKWHRSLSFTHWCLDVSVRIWKLREMARNVGWMWLVLSSCQGFGSHGLVCHRSYS